MSAQILFFVFVILLVFKGNSQESPDTTIKVLETVGVKATFEKQILNGLMTVDGKKYEVLQIADKNLPVVEKQARQIFAQVPGLFVYDMDGTGNQLNIAVRGLDPHRGWEFNFRKDGIMTNTDIYGYPASHYNLPMEAVDRIELVRGTGSLQYGAQFGGMLNFVTKTPSIKPIEVEAMSTLGSFSLLSNFVRVSGTKGKLSYSGWINRKTNDGYRENASSSYGAECLTLFWKPGTGQLSIKLEWTHSAYLTQLPGPLTDSMFMVNPRMATRSRNYYYPSIHVPSMSVRYNFSKQMEMLFTQTWLSGSRNSVMFDRPATVADLRDSLTGEYANRQVDIDLYNSFTSELRFKQYFTRSRRISMSYGTQFFHNNMFRRQQGKGTRGADYDLSINEEGWGRSLNYLTRSLALFAEATFYVSRQFLVNAGARGEYGQSRMYGFISYYPQDSVPIAIQHQFPLLGASFQYDWKKKTFIYGGISQGYRPVLLKDVVPNSVYERTDPNFRNAQGFNSEMGFKTTAVKGLYLDVTAFYLDYRRRPGTIALPDSVNGDIIFRTNIGDARTLGMEALVRYQKSISEHLRLELFTSSAWMYGVYYYGSLRNGNQNINVAGNRLENVPQWLSRNGVSLVWKRFNLSALHSYTASTFSDAYNNVLPNSTGSRGLVPDYHIFDLNIGAKVTKYAALRLNIGNITNKSYFTKRPQFYPGPGIWPSDGRTFSVTVIVKP